MPAASAIPRTTAVRVNEVRAPKTTRLRMSRPTSSVPNQCDRPGGWKVRSKWTLGPASWGKGAIAPGVAAQRTRTSTTAAPAADKGLRRSRRSQRARRRARVAAPGAPRGTASVAPGDPGELGERRQGEGEGGQGQVEEGVAQGGPVAREEGVDHVEAGERARRPAGPPDEREEAEPVGEPDLEEDADPEPGQRHAGDGEEARQVVDPRVPVGGRQDPERDADDYREEER